MARVPGSFEGSTTGNVYFLMRPIAMKGEPDDETEEIRWASPKDAVKLIRQTRNVIGRRRDLAVLKAALAVWAARR